MQWETPMEVVDAGNGGKARDSSTAGSQKSNVGRKNIKIIEDRRLVPSRNACEFLPCRARRSGPP